MRTPRGLPKVRNGAVAKRQTRSKNPATSKAFSVKGSVPRPSASRSRANSRRVSNRVGNRAGSGYRSEGRGARVLWLMILIGVALSAGFIFALRSQINAHKISRAEEQLKMKLDDYTSQQQFLTLDHQRALSAGESARAGKRNGLDHLKLDREASQTKASVQRAVSQVQSPVRAPQADQRDRLATNGSRLIKRPVKAGSQAKVVKAVKTGKAAKVVKVVKLNVAPRKDAANKARTNVMRTRKRQ